MYIGRVWLLPAAQHPISMAIGIALHEEAA